MIKRADMTIRGYCEVCKNTYKDWQNLFRKPSVYGTFLMFEMILDYVDRHKFGYI